MQQQEALIKELDAAAETIRTKRLELESKERIASEDVHNKLVLAEVKVRGEAALQTLAAEIDDVKQRLALLRHDEPIVEGTNVEPRQLGPGGGP